MAKEPVEFFILDENYPEDFGWQVFDPILTKTTLSGRLIRLSKETARDVSHFSNNRDAKRSLHNVAFFVKNTYAQTLFDSTHINLPLEQVTCAEVYELNVAGTAVMTTLVVIGSTILTVIGVLLIGIATGGSCPTIYADTPEGSVLEGDPFVGATHPQLERHDWLPLKHLKPEGNVYQLRMVNEAAEIQYINQVELVLADHPAGTTVLADKYGRLHTVSDPQSPITATDLEGYDVQQVVAKEDNRLHFSRTGNANTRAEDGLLLTFQRPAGVDQAKLVLRAKNSVWFDYAHESLQRDLGKYGPVVRQKFLEKDSAELQDWAIQQNIPLSVWLETSAGNWERAGYFNLSGTEILRNDVLLLDLSKVAGDQVHLKLTSGFLFWEIDYVALDFSSDQPLHTQVLPLASARDQDGRDLKALLQADDDQYYVQTKTGEAARLQFLAPSIPAATVRTLMLHAKGYYQILREPVKGNPGRRYLRQFTKPDAFPKYAREHWNAYVSQDTIWAAHRNR